MSQCDAIADAIVERLNSSSFSMNFSAEKPERPEVKLRREQAQLVVQVIPYGSDRTKYGAHSTERIHSANVYVTAPLSEVDQRGEFLTLVEELMDSLELVPMAGLVWSGIETITLWDRQQQRELDQFASLFRTSYKEIVSQ